MDLGSFFQIGPPPIDAINGYYSLRLVLLSYIIAFIASYVALDITERMRTSTSESASKILWLFAGGLAMGIGIWTMHFIGMLAFIMPLPMSYDQPMTFFSMLVAIMASSFAFYLIKNDRVQLPRVLMGGVLLGLGIVTMHYLGMASMIGMEIHYIPSIFFISVLIAIGASESALWLMILSSRTNKSYHHLIKIGSAGIMGFAICGMHYTGMAAAVFTPGFMERNTYGIHALDPNTLSIYIATMTLVILIIALFASKSWAHELQTRYKKLIETENSLEQKTQQLLASNQDLEKSIASSLAKEGRIRAILTAAGDGIIVADDAGTIEIVNQAAGKIFGLTTDQILSQNIFKLIEQKKYKNIQSSNSSLDFKNDALFELNILRPDGTSLPIELNFSKSEINKEVLSIIILRDITERKLAEDRFAVLNGKLIIAARFAGMAEVAACVLHNIGNVLNSVNVSAQVLLQKESEVELRIQEFAQVAKLLVEHKAKSELETFLKTNRIGQILPEYFLQIIEYLNKELIESKKELNALNNKIQHIKNIVIMQQSLCSEAQSIEKIDISELIEEAIAISSENFENNKISIKRDFAKIPLFEGDKLKTMQALINVLKNAVESLQESGNPDKSIMIKTREVDEDHIQIEITDKGIGINPENINRIFSYGFTSKKKGHGFGLHSSALSLQQIGGSLNAFSDGVGMGATFTLLLPKKIRTQPIGNPDV